MISGSFVFLLSRCKAATSRSPRLFLRTRHERSLAPVSAESNGSLTRGAGNSSKRAPARRVLGIWGCVSGKREVWNVGAQSRECEDTGLAKLHWEALSAGMQRCRFASRNTGRSKAKVGGTEDGCPEDGVIARC